MARKTTKRRKSQATPAKQRLTRRQTLTRIGAWSTGAIVLAGGGAAIALDVQRKQEELDLSVIGQGTPVVMQLHDPQCALCARLQRQTRRALRSFRSEDVIFRVADIRTEEGALRQREENLPHVTLVFYDGAGRRRHVVHGVTPAGELAALLQQHLGLQPI